MSTRTQELSCRELLAPPAWGSPLTRSPSPARAHPARRARAAQPVEPIPDGRRAALATLVARERAHVVPACVRALPAPFAQIREEVVAWFVDVAGALSLAPATTAVATSVFDRFAAAHDLPPALLNTLAATALVIAAKVAEDDAPPPEALVRYTGVPVSDVRALESVVLAELDWRLHVVTVHEAAAEFRAHLGAPLSQAQLLTLDALALAALLELPLATAPPTAVAAAMLLHTLELTPRVDQDDLVRLATLKVNVYVLARDSGIDVESVDAILPILRASMQKIFDSTLDFERHPAICYSDEYMSDDEDYCSDYEDMVDEEMHADVA